MATDFPYDLVTLGHFENGWGWEGQLRGYIRKKYRADLELLAGLAPDLLAHCLGGELVSELPYDTILWGLRLRPFRPLELFFFYNLDPEFGSDLRIFYPRKSLVLPTEDAYVFAWDFLALLARYGKGVYPLNLRTLSNHWYSLADIESRHGGDLQRFTLQGRKDIVQRISPEVAATALMRLDSGVYEGDAAGWTATWQVLPDLELRVGCTAAGLEVAYEAQGAAKYAPEFLISFAWLYLNALLRESGQVDPTLPRLSAYF
ncbi:hypothetical protein [Desulfobacca acetoxidans]|uniref:DUF3786 domain-containing protein n=1 Tax=Desulfobacca acetoxidans (strain ATCC 700848 / DSM 11109 / ASRB2) TaxID=880072 RepID=F2NH41_DESAR|nr:hypothetical protein [Desulfobacca acetoxidans]AEB08812.1 hypothetical protein Desac_0942 [Desulfobacca acetoxidans DSM 11109]